MASTQTELERMEWNLSLHPPKLDITKMKMEKLRADAKNLAFNIVTSCPDVDERRRALDTVEDALQLAIAAIARHEETPDGQG